MFRTLINYSFLLAALLVIALPATAGNIPPFCTEFHVPPATCEAEQAAPCTGACPKDGSNSFGKWQAYWSRCAATKEKKPGFVKDQFICASNTKGIKTYFYTPTQEWICCERNPSVTAEKADGAPVASQPKK